MAVADAYLRERKAFEWRRPQRFNFVRDVIAETARAGGSATALYWTAADGREEVVSYSRLLERANRAAGFLSSQGLKRGDIALLVLSREKAWWEVILGCLQLGVVASPGTAQLMKKDFAYRLKATNAAAVVTNGACAERADDAIKEVGWRGARIIVDADRSGWTGYDAESAPSARGFADTSASDEALLYFTSGTTGNPKMTVHGCAYPLGHETTGRHWLRAGPGDLVWNVSDTGWAKGAWSSLFAPWLAGAGVFAHHADTVDPVRVLDCLEKYPVTVLCAPPTAYRMLVKQKLSGRKFRRLRHCVSAGEPLNPEVIEVWRKETGHQICEGYGQTETTILCGVFDGMAVKPGSMGLPAPGVDLDVIDESGARLPPNTEGDVAVSLDPAPQGLFLGYKNDAERTNATRRGAWYMTGDRAFRDEDGYFWFVGRGDDVIISAGYRIGPFEVESALIEHPSVAESAVVASPDETRGEVVKAFVVLVKGVEGSDALARELQDHVKRVTAPYKYPRKIEFVAALPKTISGKIIRKELRDREWKGAKPHG
jgi:medium-chain acyl-CoA synthetase